MTLKQRVRQEFFSFRNVLLYIATGAQQTKSEPEYQSEKAKHGAQL